MVARKRSIGEIFAPTVSIHRPNSLFLPDSPNLPFRSQLFGRYHCRITDARLASFGAPFSSFAFRYVSVSLTFAFRSVAFNGRYLLRAAK